MRVVLLVVGLTLSLAGCASSDGGGSSDRSSGIRGVSVIDVGCPTVQVGASCRTRPVAASIEVRSQVADRVVSQLDTGPAGTFTVSLDPGRYLLIATALRALPSPQTRELEVTVPAATFTDVRLRFDSGVRVPQPYDGGPILRD